MIRFDEHIFQMGWFNHQLELIGPLFEQFFFEKSEMYAKKQESNHWSWPLSGVVAEWASEERPWKWLVLPQ